ncbi:heavy-metal-associated domain-containing protein [Flavobacterium sp. K5-23]|uniref:heavy-metal-associated domain-containing protein n=1 Tax=Flavobacterium sp. K5-23 TaxID=2746225 RepID=UPI00200DA82C|nr:heavy-metal-associated domain-containing protein [Flavobacterium sp. K5-23]UQD56669.1 heavy-metal-associated domain-containing protein [Flavobacterium sp. K5-23]
MSLLSDNVIPGKQGRIFGTNAMEEKDMLDIKNSLLEMEGISYVEINTLIFPREFTVQSTKIVAVNDIENKVRSIGFHVIPK